VEKVCSRTRRAGEANRYIARKLNLEDTIQPATEKDWKKAY